MSKKQDKFLLVEFMALVCGIIDQLCLGFVTSNWPSLMIIIIFAIDVQLILSRWNKL